VAKLTVLLAERIAASMAGKISLPLRRTLTRLPCRSGATVSASTMRAKSAVPGAGGSWSSKPLPAVRWYWTASKAYRPARPIPPRAAARRQVRGLGNGRSFGVGDQQRVSGEVRKEAGEGLLGSLVVHLLTGIIATLLWTLLSSLRCRSSARTGYAWTLRL
jgi:hypothetical protein